MNKIFKSEVLKQLRAAGYSDAKSNEDADAIIPIPKHPSLLIKEKHVQFSHSAPEEIRDLGHGIMTDIKLLAQEAQKMWDNATEMPAGSGVEDSFKKLSEYGDIVLAARDDGQYGLLFETWQYNSPEHNAVIWGHDTYNFANAKVDFATRSGLIAKEQLLNADDVTLIYCALEVLECCEHLSSEQEEQAARLYGQLKSIDPDVEDKAEGYITFSEPKTEPDFILLEDMT